MKHLRIFLALLVTLISGAAQDNSSLQVNRTTGAIIKSFSSGVATNFFDANIGLLTNALNAAGYVAGSGTIDGTLASGRVAIGSDPNTLTTDPDFTYASDVLGAPDFVFTDFASDYTATDFRGVIYDHVSGLSKTHRINGITINTSGLTIDTNLFGPAEFQLFVAGPTDAGIVLVGTEDGSHAAGHEYILATNVAGALTPVYRWFNNAKTTAGGLDFTLVGGTQPTVALNETAVAAGTSNHSRYDWTETGGFVINGTAPRTDFIDTDGTATHKRWRWNGDGGSMTLTKRTDDGSSGFAAMTVASGGGTNVASITWLADAFTFGGGNVTAPAFIGDGQGITLDDSGFSGNLANDGSTDTLQEIAAAFDAFSAAGVAADEIGTSELDDGADTPGSGHYVRVDTVDQAGFEYRTTAEVLSDIGAEPADAAIAKLDEAETISANWVNTANPWADNEVLDNLTLAASTAYDIRGVLDTHGGAAVGAAETVTVTNAPYHILILDEAVTVTFAEWPASVWKTVTVEYLQDTPGGNTTVTHAAGPTYINSNTGGDGSTITIDGTADTATQVVYASRDGGTTVFVYPPASGGTPDDNSVTSAKIVNGAILNEDINASAAIALSKLATDPLARANHTGTQTMSTVSDAGALATLNTVGIAQIDQAARTIVFPLTIDDVADSMDYTVAFVPAAFTVTEVRIVHSGTGLSTPDVDVQVRHSTDRSATGNLVDDTAFTVTSSTTGDSFTSGFEDATIAANSWIWIETSSTSGTTDDLNVIIIGDYD